MKTTKYLALILATSLAACFAAPFGGWTTAWASESSIADCLSITEDSERLACFDASARAMQQRARTPTEETVTRAEPAEPVARAEPAPAPAPAEKPPEPVEQPITSAEPAQEDFGRPPARTDEDFGRPPVKVQQEKVKKEKKKAQQVAARIVSVRKGARGNYVMTLSNGQVWEENEPNHLRKIKADQEVTVTKRRLNYLMTLESGRGVAVRRID